MKLTSMSLSRMKTVSKNIRKTIDKFAETMSPEEVGNALENYLLKTYPGASLTGVPIGFNDAVIDIEAMLPFECEVKLKDIASSVDVSEKNLSDIEYSGVLVGIVAYRRDDDIEVEFTMESSGTYRNEWYDDDDSYEPEYFNVPLSGCGGTFNLPARKNITGEDTFYETLKYYNTKKRANYFVIDESGLSFELHNGKTGIQFTSSFEEYEAITRDDIINLINNIVNYKIVDLASVYDNTVSECIDFAKLHFNRKMKDYNFDSIEISKDKESYKFIKGSTVAHKGEFRDVFALEDYVVDAIIKSIKDIKVIVEGSADNQDLSDLDIVADMLKKNFQNVTTSMSQTVANFAFKAYEKEYKGMFKYWNTGDYSIIFTASDASNINDTVENIFTKNRIPNNAGTRSHYLFENLKKYKGDIERVEEIIESLDKSIKQCTALVQTSGEKLYNDLLKSTPTDVVYSQINTDNSNVNFLIRVDNYIVDTTIYHDGRNKLKIMVDGTEVDNRNPLKAYIDRNNILFTAEQFGLEAPQAGLTILNKLELWCNSKGIESIITAQTKTKKKIKFKVPFKAIDGIYEVEVKDYPEKLEATIRLQNSNKIEIPDSTIASLQKSGYDFAKGNKIRWAASLSLEGLDVDSVYNKITNLADINLDSKKESTKQRPSAKVEKSFDSLGLQKLADRVKSKGFKFDISGFRGNYYAKDCTIEGVDYKATVYIYDYISVGTTTPMRGYDIGFYNKRTGDYVVTDFMREKLSSYNASGGWFKPINDRNALTTINELFNLINNKVEDTVSSDTAIANTETSLTYVPNKDMLKYIQNELTENNISNELDNDLKYNNSFLYGIIAHNPDGTNYQIIDLGNNMGYAVQDDKQKILLSKGNVRNALDFVKALVSKKVKSYKEKTSVVDLSDFNLSGNIIINDTKLHTAKTIREFILKHKLLELESHLKTQEASNALESSILATKGRIEEVKRGHLKVVDKDNVLNMPFEDYTIETQYISEKYLVINGNINYYPNNTHGAYIEYDRDKITENNNNFEGKHFKAKKLKNAWSITITNKDNFDLIVDFFQKEGGTLKGNNKINIDVDVVPLTMSYDTQIDELIAKANPQTVASDIAQDTPKAEVKPKVGKVTDPDQKDQLERLALIAKLLSNQVDSDDNYTTVFLEEPKEFKKYKLPTVALALVCFDMSKSDAELKQSTLFKKFKAARGTSLVGKWFTSDLNGRPCKMCIFIDKQYEIQSPETKKEVKKLDRRIKLMESIGDEIKVSGESFLLESVGNSYARVNKNGVTNVIPLQYMKDIK